MRNIYVDINLSTSKNPTSHPFPTKETETFCWIKRDNGKSSISKVEEETIYFDIKTIIL